MSSTKTIHQLKITLGDIRPPVWRRVQVPSTITLGELHLVIQAAFGWWDYHLHEFEINGIRYGTDDGEGWGDPPKDEHRAKLERLAPVGGKIGYVYDFGDNWKHTITVEKVLPADPRATYPACVAGKRACPPEDCGGTWGYADFLEAIANPDHQEHKAMLEWVGHPFDPEHFDRGDFQSNLERGSVLD